MNIYPSNLSTQVDFDQVLARLKSHCHSAMAKSIAEDLAPSADFRTIQIQLNETNEFLLTLHQGLSVLTHSFPEINKELQLLQIEDAVLSAMQMHHVRKVIEQAQQVIHFFKDKETVYPALKNRIDLMKEDKTALGYINDIMDKDGLVRENASALLASIRNELQANRKTSERIYRAHLQRYGKLGYLADIQESFINGRRVLAILSEFKREVKGILLGQSSTGSITFIEPQNVIELNNDQVALEEEERKEIHRILRDLTELIRPYLPFITGYFHALVELDFIQAKALLAKELNATMPILHNDSALIKLINAFHPVLLMQNKTKGLETVPINCNLSDHERIMVISGPNAGGKSITLKTIGLLQIMLQSGLLIPASAKSEMGIKRAILGDIGDNQSIEDGLSTYSSRLTKMKYFLEFADRHTLFLIDEFGTGSDPDMGGALAEVILDKLNNAKAQGIVTTHFTNLKILATNKEGIFNACMLFNNKTLKPLYQLHIGEPGSSFTFEVAEKIGLSKEFIDEAKTKLSDEKVFMDKLLNKLQSEKNVIAKLKKDLLKQMSKATAEKREFQQLSEKMNEHFFNEHKNRDEKQKLMEYGKKLEQLTKEWQENKNKKEVIDKFVKLAGYEIHKQRTLEAYEKTEKFREQKIARIKVKIKTGSKVRMMKSRETGIIKEIKADRANVLFGNIIMNVGLEKLEVVES